VADLKPLRRFSGDIFYKAHDTLSSPSFWLKKTRQPRKSVICSLVY
jgi:hypothetical protein